MKAKVQLSYGYGYESSDHETMLGENEVLLP